MEGKDLDRINRQIKIARDRKDHAAVLILTARRNPRIYRARGLRP